MSSRLLEQVIQPLALSDRCLRRFQRRCHLPPSAERPSPRSLAYPVVPEGNGATRMPVGAPVDTTFPDPEVAGAVVALMYGWAERGATQPISGYRPARSTLRVEAQRDHCAAATRTAKAGPFLDAAIHDVNELTVPHLVAPRVGGHPPDKQVVPDDAERFEEPCQEHTHGPHPKRCRNGSTSARPQTPGPAHISHSGRGRAVLALSSHVSKRRRLSSFIPPGPRKPVRAWRNSLTAMQAVSVVKVTTAGAGSPPPLT